MKRHISLVKGLRVRIAVGSVLGVILCTGCPQNNASHSISGNQNDGGNSAQEFSKGPIVTSLSSAPPGEGVCKPSGAVPCNVSKVQFDSWQNLAQVFQIKGVASAFVAGKRMVMPQVGESLNKAALETVGSLGSDMMAVSKFVNQNPDHNLTALMSAPMTMGAVTRTIIDGTGHSREILLHGKQSMLRGLSNSMESGNSSLSRTSSSAAGGSLSRVAAGVSEDAALGSTSTSITPTTCDPTAEQLPVVLCDGTDEGTGKGYDVDAWAPKNMTHTAQNSLLSKCNFPLKASLTCVKDQGQRATCSAFSLIGALEAGISSKLNHHVNLSKQQLYYQIKAKWDVSNASVGGYDPLELVKHIVHEGYWIPFESQWNYNQSNCMTGSTANSCINTCSSTLASTFGGDVYPEYCSDTESQGQSVIDDAGRVGFLTHVATNHVGGTVHKFDNIWSSTTDNLGANGSPILGTVSDAILTRVESYLNQGVPVVTAVWLTNGFLNAQDGRVADPLSQADFIDTRSGEPIGGHAVLLVAYIPNSLASGFGFSSSSPKGGIFIVKNSWGPSVGDAGYYYVSDQYLSKAATEFIAITDVGYSPGT